MKKQYMILIALMFCMVLISFVKADNYCVGATTNFTCGDTITESCTMNGDLDCSGISGFTIGDDNLVIDGNGKIVTSDVSGTLISTDQFVNTTIKNFILNNTGDSYGAIYINSNDNNIINNTIYDYGVGSYSIGIYGSEATILNNNISFNKLFIEYPVSEGISLGGANDTNIFENTIIASGEEVYGIHLDTSNHNNLFNNNITSNYESIDIESSHYNNITHSIVYINDGFGLGYSGIYLYTSDNNFFLDNNITINDSDSKGLYVDSSSNNFFYNFNITLYQGDNCALCAEGSNYDLLDNYFDNFNIETKAEDIAGLQISSGSGKVINNNFNNFDILTTGSSSSYGLFIYESGGNITNNFFNNFYIETNGDGGNYGVYFSEANICGYDEELGDIYCNTTDTMANNTIKDSIIYVSYEGTPEIYSDWYSIDNLINCTFNKNEVTIDSDFSMINNYWYTDTKVLSSSTGLPISGATIYITDENGDTVFSGTTAGNGYIQRQILKEFSQNATDRYYTSLHNFSASKSGYVSNSTAYNVTTNNIGSVMILLSGITPPVPPSNNTGQCIPSNYLDLKCILVNEVAGTPMLFVFLALVVILYFAIQFRMSTGALLMVVFLFLLIMAATLLKGAYVVLILFGLVSIAGWLLIKALTSQN